MLLFGVSEMVKYQLLASASAAVAPATVVDGAVFKTSTLPLQESVPTEKRPRPGPAETVALERIAESKAEGFRPLFPSALLSKGKVTRG